MNAVKYNFPMSVGQSLGTFGSITYHPTDRLRISAFGSYSPDSRYGFNRNVYGATVGYDLQIDLVWKWVCRDITILNGDGRLFRLLHLIINSINSIWALMWVEYYMKY